jgi:hypothetical protein
LAWEHFALARSDGWLALSISKAGDRERACHFPVDLAAGLPGAMRAQPWWARRSCNTATGIDAQECRSSLTIELWMMPKAKPARTPVKFVQ